MDGNYEWHLEQINHLINEKSELVKIPCMISLGFIVSFRLCEMVCMVTILPLELDGPEPEFEEKGSSRTI